MITQPADNFKRSANNIFRMLSEIESYIDKAQLNTSGEKQDENSTRERH